MIYTGRMGEYMSDRGLGRFDYQRAIQHHEARMRTRHELEQETIAAARDFVKHLPLCILDDEVAMGRVNRIAEALRALDALDTH